MSNLKEQVKNNDYYNRNYRISKNQLEHKYKRGQLLQDNKTSDYSYNYLLVLGLIIHTKHSNKILYLVKVGLSSKPKLNSNHMMHVYYKDDLENCYKLSLSETLKDL